IEPKKDENFGIDYFIESKVPIKINEKVYIIVKKNEENSYTKGISYTLELYSYCYDFKELKNMIDAMLISYNKHLDLINNDDKYGIQYSLGFMFYGSPGCGKTSTIKAIANYTKRHILEIPLSRVKTCAELKNIFYLDEYNNVKIPFEKKIIVFEDIDCMRDI